MQRVLTTNDHYAKPAVITVRTVLKRYQRGKRTVEALRGVSLEVKPGQIFCLLGPNGAGKTTLIKIIAGTLLADGGQVLVNGYDVRRQRQALTKQLGVVFETAQNVYGYLTAEQNLRYFGCLGKVPQTALHARVQELLSLFDLLACRAVPANRLSRGMQQKLALAVALLRHPSVLLLDEPTLGLDVMAAATIKSIIKSIAEDEERSVLLTTHNMPLAEELGHYFAFIDHGCIVWQGSKHDLRSLEFFHCRYLVRAVQNGVADIGSLKDALAPHCIAVDIQDNTVNVSCAEQDLGLVINQMTEMKATIESVARVETTLEEVFMQIFQKGDAWADALGNTV